MLRERVQFNAGITIMLMELLKGLRNPPSLRSEKW